MRRFACLLPAAGLAAAVVSILSPAAMARPKPLEGPIPAFVEQVVDGDTLQVRARIWLGQELQVLVRLKGVDAPEMKARCDEERQMARSARDFVQRAVGQRKVLLSQIREDKYAGRVVAEVAGEDGRSLSARLIEAKLARAYQRGPRLGWCERASAETPARPMAEKGIIPASLDAIRSFARRRLTGLGELGQQGK